MLPVMHFDTNLTPLRPLQVDSFDKRRHDRTTFLLVKVHDLLSDNGNVYVVVLSERCTRSLMH